MKKYVLCGDEYLGDGVVMTVTIRTGTKKQCTETMNRLEGDGQYFDMFVFKDDDHDDGDD
jgi:hypothetical protein